MSARGQEFAGRAVTVMGLGLYGGGAAVTRFLLKRGAHVTVTDLRNEQQLAPTLKELGELPVRFVLGGHERADFKRADWIVVNPAVPRTSPLLAAAREAGARITSEIALFLEHCPARIAAVTGTQGKSSTTNYLAQLMSHALPERRVFLGGNIGRSLLDDLGEMGARDLCALELSSYQLECLPEDLGRPREDSPIDVAVFTNILADHLERHGTPESYAKAKLRLLELLAPGAAVLLPAEGMAVAADPAPDLYALEHPSAALRLDERGYSLDGELLAGHEHDAHLKGFQRSNLHLALAAARLMGAPAERLSGAVAKLRGLPHRLDLVGRIAGRRLWDNGISTAPDSTISAIEALPMETTVMLGGQVKDIELAPLIACLSLRKARVLIFGAARSSWTARFEAEGLEVREASGPHEALDLALELGNGDLLFSPACSSFDAYPNVIARAEDFLSAARGAGIENDGPLG